MSALLLPDSRMKSPKSSKTMFWPGYGNIEVEQVFCANCGKEHGWVPQQNTTYAFWLCTYCAETYGDKLPGYLMPDEVYWEMVRLETGGLTLEKIRQLMGSATSLLSKLVRLQPKGRN